MLASSCALRGFDTSGHDAVADASIAFGLVGLILGATSLVLTLVSCSTSEGIWNLAIATAVIGVVLSSGFAVAQYLRAGGQCFTLT